MSNNRGDIGDEHGNPELRFLKGSAEEMAEQALVQVRETVDAFAETRPRIASFIAVAVYHDGTIGTTCALMPGATVKLITEAEAYIEQLYGSIAAAARVEEAHERRN